MLSDQIGLLLRSARRYLNISRVELANRGGVSVRLVAELERGQRPNVSLETTLKLMGIVGVSVIAKAPDGTTAEIRSASAGALERAARAEHRRQTWSGRHVHLHDEGMDPAPERSKSKRLASVSQVSKQAYVVASAIRRPATPRSKSRTGR